MEPHFTHSYASLPPQFYAEQSPEPVEAPELMLANTQLAGELGIDPSWLKSPAGIAMLSGNALPDSARPIAAAYAGHQFGNFVPQLGDGRAILIGELRGYDIQLKGSGRTPFSRGGDGKSALGPVIREYLVSEAMHALGVPTTRALAAVATGEPVYRREGAVPGGVFTRVASSHIRVGTFEYFAARGDTGAVRLLADYARQRHYSDAQDARELLSNVIGAQASLVAHWMSLGFIHGVMNTDNCAISGETIDYGPCAFMDEFHPQCVFSSIDQQSRYSWENQARMAHWNLTRFAETLVPLLDDDEATAIAAAKDELAQFAHTFKKHYLKRFRAKVGHVGAPESFVDETLGLMANQQRDFTIFFRDLTRLARGETCDLAESAPDYVAKWRALGTADASLMARSNPVRIPRNHRVEEAIEAAYDGDYSIFRRLNCAWATPFEESSDFADLELAPTDDQRVRETFCGT